jgi:hypothetical protein
MAIRGVTVVAFHSTSTPGKLDFPQRAFSEILARRCDKGQRPSAIRVDEWETPRAMRYVVNTRLNMPTSRATTRFKRLVGKSPAKLGSSPEAVAVKQPGRTPAPL